MFERGSISLYTHDLFYSFGTLMNSLYRFNLDIKFSRSLFHVKILLILNIVYVMKVHLFWHQRLGHISKETLMR